MTGEAFTWERLRDLARSLDLPGVTDAVSWGQPNLKAHGKMWCWWSPHEDAPVFKTSFEERDFLCEADPETFFFTAHYRSYPMVLVRPDRLDPDWARARLLQAWKDMAPKKVLKAWEASRG